MISLWCSDAIISVWLEKEKEMNVCRGLSEVFDVFLIIPYKMQTCCVPSLFKTLKTFSGAKCLQDKVQAPKCGFIISLFLTPPAFSSCPASTPSPLPPQGSALLLAPCRLPCPMPTCTGCSLQGRREHLKLPVTAVPPDLEAVC